MKHTLNTVMRELNHYVGTDMASGLVPITPIHLELNKLKQELQQFMDGERGSSVFGHIRNESQAWYLIKEILGDE